MWQRAVNGSGGGLSEITLWENPNPSATQTSLTPSWSGKDIDDYKYIGFLFKSATTTSVDATANIWIYTTPEKLKQSLTSTNANCLIAGTTVTSGFYYRQITYASDSSVNISAAVGNGGNNQYYCIPVKIVGLS